MKKRYILLSIIFPLLACQNSTANIEVKEMELPAEYLSLIQTLNSLYMEKTNNTDSNRALDKKIEILETYLLKQYPDFVSTDEDVGKEGKEQNRF